MFQSYRTDLALLLVTLATFCCGLAGCTNGPLNEATWRNPFETVDTTYKEAYGQTPSEVAKQLRNLSGKVAEMAAADQQKTALDLTKRYESENDPLLRRELIYALGSFPDPYVAPGLRAAMSDPDPFVRVEACRAWGRRSSAEAMRVLANAIEMDESVDVRQAAIQNIKRFEHPDAVRALAGALRERDPALQLLAMQSLKGASGKDLGNDVRTWDEFIAANYPTPAVDPVVASGALDGESIIDDSSDANIWR